MGIRYIASETYVNKNQSHTQKNKQTNETLPITRQSKQNTNKTPVTAGVPLSRIVTSQRCHVIATV